LTAEAPLSTEAPPLPPPAGGQWVGKVLYAMVFCVVIPAGLALWAHAISPMIPWPVFRCPALGTALVCTGIGLILLSFHALHRHGRGLPMNAFPPPLYVTCGPYRLTRHPIYLGFSIACLGAAVASGSSGGFWFVTPIAMIGCAAIVWGYERPDLLRRFGSLVDHQRPLLSFPHDRSAAPSLYDRLAIYPLLLLPWLILYTTTPAIPRPSDAFAGYLPFEHRLPVWQWTELVYGSTYFMVLLVPLLAKTQKDLRLFARAGVASMAIIFAIYLVIPIRVPARPFVATTTLGRLLLIERDYDAHGANACPSYHVFWALLAAVILARRGKVWRFAAPLWAILIAASCITTGQHALVDVLAAFAVLPVCLYLPAIYLQIVRATNRLANSFRSRRFGPLRIINHGLYSGLAAGVGILIVGALVGPGHLLAVLAVAVCSIIGAGLWAQLVEGSPRLLRPFGYYGSLVGGVGGAALAPMLGASPLLILTAFAVAAPIIQAIGRLRCIVQGCCHGSPLPPALAPEWGHRVHNPSSRVCKLSPFADTPIHPTPLYSILGNLVIALPLARLWTLHAPLALIGGLYLILAGLARFIEEAYRGEPQTRRFAGLPEYQWYAIVSVVAGAVVTVLPLAERAPRLVCLLGFGLGLMAAAVAMGLVAAFAMSMDFPSSNRRFARLTG